jgi:hypothetical protein
MLAPDPTPTQLTLQGLTQVFPGWPDIVGRLAASSLIMEGSITVDVDPQPPSSHVQELGVYGKGPNLLIMLVYRRERGCELLAPGAARTRHSSPSRPLTICPPV